MSAHIGRMRELVDPDLERFLSTVRLREPIHFVKPLFRNFTITHGILQSDPQAKNSTQDF